jgi:hypothetical protein
VGQGFEGFLDLREVFLNAMLRGCLTPCRSSFFSIVRLSVMLMQGKERLGAVLDAKNTT